MQSSAISYNQYPALKDKDEAFKALVNSFITELQTLSVEQKRKLGYKALEVMEQHLKQQDYFVAGKYTIADIGLYAYTHVAEEGGFDLTKFPAITAWFERVKSQPRHIKIADSFK